MPLGTVMFPMGLGGLSVILNADRIISTKLNLSTHNATGPSHQDQKDPECLDWEILHQEL